MNRMISILVLSLSIVVFCIHDTYAQQPADYVLSNAKIYTVNKDQPWAEAIAISGTDIVYVGDNAGAQKFVGESTKTADMEGLLILPGIVSGHEHPLVTAVISAALYIPYSEDKEKMLNAIRDYKVSNPEGPKWSFGGSYEGRVDITRHDIDKIFPDEPFVMIAASGHGAWINTKALEAMGIVKDKPDPIDVFEREPDGTPTGYLSTSAAALYAITKLKLVKKEDVVRNLPKVVANYNGYGLTAVQDAAVPVGSEEEVYSAVYELEQAGRLNLRISACAMAQRPVHLEHALSVLNKLSPKYKSEIFAVRTLKIHGGSPDGYSSPLLEPYSDRPGYNPEIFPRDVRLEWSLKTANAGFDIHTHVMGDRAIRDALDAFQAIRGAGLNDVRLSTGHSTMIHPEDQQRYAKYNVTCNVFASKNASPDPTALKRVGPERLKYWQPMQSLIKKGARLAMSADAPTAPLDPWLQMEVAILRKEPAQTEQLNPEEGLTIEQVVEAYTMGAAYQIRGEELFGSLEVGKRADLVVLSQNIFEIESSDIHNTKALVTMMNGNVVYRQDSADRY